MLILIPLLLIYLHSETVFPLYNSIDTVYSENFSWKKFDQIKIGATKKDLIDALGKPLFVKYLNNYECWDYSKDGKLYPIADFAFIQTKVCFENDILRAKTVNIFRN